MTTHLSKVESLVHTLPACSHAKEPRTFINFSGFRRVYIELVEKSVIVPKMEVPPPTVPMDYNWARELGLIRKPASFMTSICDERGQELLYAGVPITTVFEEGLGIGGVLGLLWFQKRCVTLQCWTQRAARLGAHRVGLSAGSGALNC